jgi:hypothetical protein
MFLNKQKQNNSEKNGGVLKIKKKVKKISE